VIRAAPTQAGALSCPHCGGLVAVTDHACEFCAAQLMVRACPRCLARVFHGHKHCPHCGAATDVAATGGATSERVRECPRCSGGHGLVARLLGDIAVDDCPACGGVFIDGAAIERLLGDRQQVRAETVLGVYRGQPRASDITRPGGKLYIKCPDCKTVMNRRQLARGAGVVVDVCRGHGTWFDAGELPVVIEFVMNGGLERAEKAEIADQREAARRAKADAIAAGASMPVDYSPRVAAGGALLDLLFTLWR
jgi:Zn-finger nucleic acid-binding protein